VHQSLHFISFPPPLHLPLYTNFCFVFLPVTPTPLCSANNYLDHSFFYPASAPTPSTRHDNLERSHPQTRITSAWVRFSATATANTTHDSAEHPKSLFFPQQPTNSIAMGNLDNANVSQDQTHPSNHQAAPESSLSSITSAKGQQGFEAATAVLDTNELLHMIIAEFPLKYRASLLGISKSWNAAITKIKYTLEPSSHQMGRYSLSHDTVMHVRTPWLLYVDDTANFPGLPMLLPTAALEMHPQLPEEKEVSGPGFLNNALFPTSGIHAMALGSPHTEVREYHQGCVPFASEVVGQEHQFISSPLLTEVMMTAGPHGDDPAILRVREGIRIGDLIRYQKKMLPNARYPNVWWNFGREGLATIGGLHSSSRIGQTQKP